MIRNIVSFVCAMLLLAGCGNKLPEQYVLVEWGTSGKDIVVNNLDESISFKIHSEDFGKDSVVVIKSRESASYDRGAFRPMVSVSSRKPAPTRPSCSSRAWKLSAKWQTANRPRSSFRRIFRASQVLRPALLRS